MTSVTEPSSSFTTQQQPPLSSSATTYHNGNSAALDHNYNPTYEQFDNYPASNSYHYRPREFASSSAAAGVNASSNPPRQATQGAPSALQDDRLGGGAQQSRRRFQRRKQMKRSKSADLYQEPSSVSSSRNQANNNYFFPSTTPPDANQLHRQPRSISRDLIGEGADGNLSASSSTSSSSIAHIERTNRDALLRYKSLDSMTFNNRKLNGTRRAVSKPTNVDFDSDDSVCGIPKPRK